MLHALATAMLVMLTIQNGDLDQSRFVLFALAEDLEQTLVGCVCVRGRKMCVDIDFYQILIRHARLLPLIPV